MKPTLIERGGLWVAGQIVLILAIIVGTTHNGTWVWPPTPAGIVGIGLLVLGSVIALPTFIALGHNLTPFPQPRADGTLTQRGPYAFVRHPMYFAMILLGFGWALAWHSRVGTIAAIVLAVFIDRKAAREECWLLQKFPDYARYRTRVAKLIPWIY